MRGKLEWPQLYRCREFGREMVLNTLACESAFLDEVSAAILDLAGRVESFEEVPVALAPRYPPTRVADGLRYLDEAGIFATQPAPLATEKYQQTKQITVTLNVAQYCNLRCRYCYIEGDVLASKALMPPAVARRAVDFIFAKNLDMERLGVSFYGGEPLLNFPVIKDVIIYANRRAKGAGLPEVEYHLSTNGTCLTDEMIDFFSRQNINVLVSLDGPAAIHDAMRRDASGNATHARVMASLGRLLAAGDRLSVSASAVVSRKTRLIDAYNYLRNKGFQDVKISYVRYRNEDYFGLEEEVKERYIEDLRLIAEDCLSQLENGERPAFYEFNRRILHLWSKTRRVEFCPAGQTRFGVGTRGDLFPCGPAASMGDSPIGDVRSGVVQERLERFIARNDIDSSDSCRHCWGRFLCGGGCPLPLVRGSQENCDLTLAVTRLALYIYLSMREKNEFLLSTLIDENLPLYVTELVRAASREGDFEWMPPSPT